MSSSNYPVVLSVSNITPKADVPAGFLQNTGSILYGGYTENELQLTLTTADNYKLDSSKNVSIFIPTAFLSTSSGITISWNGGNPVPVTPTTSGSNYEFSLTFSGSPTLSPTQSIPIIMKGLSANVGPLVAGQITVNNLYYEKTLLGRSIPTELDVNSVGFSVLSASSGAAITANYSLDSSTFNDTAEANKYNLNNNVYKSVMQGSTLIVPVANTVTVDIVWQNNSSVATGNDGSFLIWFDYGSGPDLTPSQLCTNLPSGKGIFGLSVFDWPNNPALVVKSYSGKEKPGQGGGTDISTNWAITRQSGSGAWQLGPANNSYQAPWNQTITFQITFDRVVSGNGLAGQTQTNIYALCTGITGVADTLIIRPFTLVATTPKILNFSLSGQTSGSFAFDLFGVTKGMLSWKNQNGLDDVLFQNRNLTQKDFMGASFNINDSSTWSLYYSGTVTGIYTNIDTIVTLNAFNPGSATSIKSSLALSPNSSYQTLKVNSLNYVSGDINNDESETFTGYTWQVSGLANDGLCVLTIEITVGEGDSPQFINISVPGSTNAGQGVYLYSLREIISYIYTFFSKMVIDGKTIGSIWQSEPSWYKVCLYLAVLFESNGFSLNIYLTAVQGTNKATSETINGNGTPLNTPLTILHADMCILNGTLFLAYADTNASINVMQSNDGTQWTSLKTEVEQSTIVSPSITSDGEQLYLMYASSSGKQLKILSSPDGQTWSLTASDNQLTGSSTTLTSPTYPGQLVYMKEGNGTAIPGLYTVFQDESNNGYIAATKSGWGANSVTTLNPVTNTNSGLSLAYFNNDYYIAYCNTSNDLALIKNLTLLSASYDTVSLNPAVTGIIGTPQVTVFKNRLVIIYLDNKYRINYTYSADGTTWTQSAVIKGVFAVDFTVQAFYNNICVAYVVSTADSPPDVISTCFISDRDLGIPSDSPFIQ